MIKRKTMKDGKPEALSREARLIRVVLALAVLAVLGPVFVWGPGGLSVSPCLFREATGLSCFTCGLSRSLDAAMHGRFEAAFHFHLLGPFLLVGLLLLSLVLAGEAVTGRRLLAFRSGRQKLYLLLGIPALWVIYGVGRIIYELT